KASKDRAKMCHHSKLKYNPNLNKQALRLHNMYRDLMGKICRISEATTIQSQSNFPKKVRRQSSTSRCTETLCARSNRCFPRLSGFQSFAFFPKSKPKVRLSYLFRQPKS